MSLDLSQMIFDINWAIFRIKETFEGHITLTLMSLEKIWGLNVHATNEVFITYGSKVMAKNKACVTNGAIFRIKVTVKVI